MLILTFLLSISSANCGDQLARSLFIRAQRINPALKLEGQTLEDHYLALKREAERPDAMTPALRQHLEDQFGRHFVIGEAEEATRFYRNSLWNLRAAIARRWLKDTAAPIAAERGLDPAFVTRLLDSFFEPAGHLVSLEGPQLLAKDVALVFAQKPWESFPWDDTRLALERTAGVVGLTSQTLRAIDPELADRLGVKNLRRLDRAQMEVRQRFTRDGHTCCQNHEQRCQICPLNYYWHRDAKNRVYP